MIEVVPVVQALERDFVPDAPKDFATSYGMLRSLFVVTIGKPTWHEDRTETRREGPDVSQVLDGREADRDVPSTIAEVEGVDVCPHDLDAFDLGLERDVHPCQREPGIVLAEIREELASPRSDVDDRRIRLVPRDRLGQERKERHVRVREPVLVKSLPRLVVLTEVLQRLDVGKTVVAARAPVEDDVVEPVLLPAWRTADRTLEDVARSLLPSRGADAQSGRG